MSEKPICTVLLITYNHAPYIRKSIDSVLAQKTKYPFIIKIFDDASTDGSSDIIREYAEKYPDKIEAHIREENVGAQTNFWEAYESVDTKYCCPMETDDYWCDENKLELQITALEEHPECSFAASNSAINILTKSDLYRGRAEYVLDSYWNHKSIINYNDLLKVPHSFLPHTSTRCLNMQKIDIENLKHKENLNFDAEQFFLFLSKGDLYYFYKNFSVYQRTGNGAASAKSNAESLQQFVLHLVYINQDTNYIFWKKIYSLINIISTWRMNLEDTGLDSSSKKTTIPITSKIYYLFGIPVFKITTKKSSKYFYILGVRVLKISTINEYKGK